MSDAIARFIGIDKIIEGFEIESETPYWSIWDKTQKMSQYNGSKGDDMESSLEKLQHALNTCQDNYTRPIVIKLHPNKEKSYTQKSDYSSSLYCLVKEKPSYLPTTPGGTDSSYNNYVLMKEMEALKTEINALKTLQLQEDQEEDDEEQDDIMSGFNKLLDHPIIIGLANKFMGGSSHATHLSGVNKNIDEILNVLFAKGVTVEHLQILSEMPEPKLKMLISML